MSTDPSATTHDLEQRARAHGFSKLLQPADCAELVAAIRELHAAGRAFCPVGAGSRLGWGAACGGADVLVSTARLEHVTRFAPEDLTCGVEPGVRLGTLLAKLAEHELTFEPGPFAGAAGRTIGGLLAEAPPSPRGHDRGSLRSHVLGVAAVDATGREFKAGGNVVKNVAGYDLGKLFVGSGGAYFVAVELQLRLSPLPATCAWLASERLDRTSAARLWLAVRDRLPDARAVDLVVEADGGARVEAQVAGTPQLVGKLASGQELNVLAEGRECWQREPAELTPSGVVVRGRLLAASVPAFASRLPADCQGRVHMHGAFALQAQELAPAVFPEDAIVRCIRGGGLGEPAPAAIAQRLKQVFGGICPGRTSFDTGAGATA